MYQTIDVRLKVLVVVSAILVVFGFGAVVWTIAVNSAKMDTYGVPQLKLEMTEFDFGDISMADGLAKKVIKISNQGDGDLELSKMFTSCMCTKVSLLIDGKKSPEFGMQGHGAGPMVWSQKLKPGQEGELEIVFDPNAHGPNAIGPIDRIVSILSNDGGQVGSSSVINFKANVTK